MRAGRHLNAVLRRNDTQLCRIRGVALQKQAQNLLVGVADRLSLGHGEPAGACADEAVLPARVTAPSARDAPLRRRSRRRFRFGVRLQSPRSRG